MTSLNLSKTFPISVYEYTFKVFILFRIVILMQEPFSSEEGKPYNINDRKWPDRHPDTILLFKCCCLLYTIT